MTTTILQVLYATRAFLHIKRCRGNQHTGWPPMILPADVHMVSNAFPQCILISLWSHQNMAKVPLLGGSVGCSIIPYTKRLHVWSPVREHTGGKKTMFLSLSPKSVNVSPQENFKNLHKWEWITSKVRSKRHCGFCLPLSRVEETSCHAMLWGQPGSPQDRPTGRGTEAFCQHPCEWVRPGSQYFSPFILQRHEALGDSWTSTCWDPDVQSSS